MRHQYIERLSGKVCDERPLGDKAVALLYSQVREHSPTLFRLFTSRRWSKTIAQIAYDLPGGGALCGVWQLLREGKINLAECVEESTSYKTPREIFERQIRYWECRPMNNDPQTVASPCDARMLLGSLADQSSLFIKEKFFSYPELLGTEKLTWRRTFFGSDFAVFRLTPEKYHYVHWPVTGEVVDYYEIDGEFHACNPNAVIALATPYSKNKRVVTIVDTDVTGGTGVGFVAIIEIVALMVGEIVQAYSTHQYDEPQDMQVGMFFKKGSPKSLFRPGSSTVVLLFEKNRVAFSKDLVRNTTLPFISSRYSRRFGAPIVETDLQVRSTIATRATELTELL